MNKNLKRGKEVVVISGANKGQRGKLLEVFPKTGRVKIEGVNKGKKTVKPSQDNQEGGFIESERSIHSSNVMLADVYDAKKRTS